MSKPIILLILLALLSQDYDAPAQETQVDTAALAYHNNPGSSLAVMPVFILQEKFGAGICYEYFLGSERKMSLSFPLFYSFPYSGNDPDFIHDEHHRFLEAPQYKDLHYQKDDGNGSVYFNPGIKVYPGKGYNKLRYALGVTLVFNAGSMVRHTKDYEISPVWQGNGGMREYERKLLREDIATLSVFKMGSIFTNSLYYYTTNHLFLAGEVGVGYGLYSKLDNFNAPNEPMVQGAVKVGYAW